MKTITFLNIKGGVGKSATSITIAHMLAEYFKKKVLIIDMDPQGNTSLTFSNINVIKYFENLLTESEIEVEDCTIEDLLLDSQIDIHKSIIHTDYPGLDIIPSLLTLSEAEQMLKADITSPQQFRLANHLKAIEDEYDYCIIDCSPSINIININALAASDEVYIPMKCDAWSGIGMCVAKRLINTVSMYSPKLKYKGCFFTQWEANKNVSKTVLELLKINVGDELLPVTIRKSKLIEEMSYMQKPLLCYDTKKGYDGVTKDYLKLTKMIMQ